MDTLRHLYRIGHGPSSSHTMAPRSAAETFLKENPDAARFEITLYGSLASTGKGHFTDVALFEVFGKDRLTILWHPEIVPEYHPNGMLMRALDAEGNEITQRMIYSTGGGALSLGPEDQEAADVYPLTNMTDILNYLVESGKSYWEFVEENEGPEIWDYLREVKDVMYDSIERGLNTEGVIPGGLGVSRKAPVFYRRGKLMNPTMASVARLTAYTLAVSEENASGKEVVTAPTCGSCGVVPGILRYLQENLQLSDEIALKALATAGVFGNVVKENGSISGAEVGCQGEIGVAAAMGAALAAYMYFCSVRQIEYAAEMALEHHLGLTCDPVNGLVQVPCIERNAFSVGTSLYVAEYVSFTDGSHMISFDQVVDVMVHTGIDMPAMYRETGTGGLAKSYARAKKKKKKEQN